MQNNNSGKTYPDPKYHNTECMCVCVFLYEKHFNVNEINYIKLNEIKWSIKRISILNRLLYALIVVDLLFSFHFEIFETK